MKWNLHFGSSQRVYTHFNDEQITTAGGKFPKMQQKCCQLAPEVDKGAERAPESTPGITRTMSKALPAYCLGSEKT